MEIAVGGRRWALLSRPAPEWWRTQFDGHPYVVFFGGHTLHRSHANRSATRSRRAFVAHYCNARSYVPWDDQPLQDGEMANDRHILAHGSTHLPHASPRWA